MAAQGGGAQIVTNRGDILNSSIAPVAALLLSLLCASSARAQICPNPTAEVSEILASCASMDACRSITKGISNCTAFVRMASNFLTAKKPAPDTNEFQTERYAAPGPSEVEQARKDSELYRLNRVIEADKIKTAAMDVRVNDPRLVGLLEANCTDPLDSLCLTYVGEAQKLGQLVEAFNQDGNLVRAHGEKLRAASPALAEKIAMAGEKAWKEREARKKKAPETSQPSASSQEAIDKKNKLTIDNNLAMVQEQRNQQERDRIKNAAAAAAAADAAAQRAANAAAADKRAAAATDNNDAAAIAAGLGQFIDAYGKLQKAKQDAKQPAPAVRPPPGKGGSTGGGGCGGIGSTTCR